MKVFGLKEIGNKVSESLIIKIKDKNDPDKWNWVPAKPDKIKNLKKHINEERELVDYAVITNYEPRDKIQDIVLVFSMGNLSFAMINNLEKNNIPFYFFDYTQFVALGKVNVEITDLELKTSLTLLESKLDLRDVKYVIWTEPKYPYPLYDNEMLPKARNRNKFLFKKRWADLLKNLHLLLRRDTVWIPGNPLIGSQDWQNKIGELNLAQKIGLKVPPTIFTNEKDKLISFAKTDKILLREFSTPPYSFPPYVIDNINTINLSGFKSSPVCFQKYIDKKFEFRVVYLFGKVYPVKIYSQDSQLAKTDWRVHDDSKVKWELCELPADVNEKLVMFAKEFNLNWCSFDLILSLENEYYFLEANRPGAHYWLDLFVGLDITKEITDYIIRSK